MKLLMSPHDDDNALFAAFTCMRERPLVVVCLDSYIQPNRGEIGCSAEERAAETADACRVLGCDVMRLGLRDDADDIELEEDLYQRFREFQGCEITYAPALQGGNKHHDMVARAAERALHGNIRRYTTYTKIELHTIGDVEIVPTAEELDLKAQALVCYVSQLRINRPHFDAVMGKSEWLLV